MYLRPGKHDVYGSVSSEGLTVTNTSTIFVLCDLLVSETLEGPKIGGELLEIINVLTIIE